MDNLSKNTIFLEASLSNLFKQLPKYWVVLYIRSEGGEQNYAGVEDKRNTVMLELLIRHPHLGF